MTQIDFYENRLQSRRGAYEQLLTESESVVDSCVQRKPGSVRSLHFADLVIDMLASQSMIPASDQMEGDEYLKDHFLEAAIGQSHVMVLASGLFKVPDGDGYALHLFTCDYDPTRGVKPFPVEKFQENFKLLTNFYRHSVNGKLLKEVSTEHPAYEYIRRISLHKDEIQSIRCWVITNKLYVRETGKGRGDVGGKEITGDLIDLNRILDLKNERLEIIEEFDGRNRLPTMKVGNDGQDYTCYLTTVTGRLLCELYSKHGTALVQTNVRSYLGENKVNKRVKETIAKEPENFLAYNNGLVMTASNVTVDAENRITRLENIQIINGGQTTANIYQAWLSARNARSEEAKARAGNIDRILVPVKLIVPNAGLDEKTKATLCERISEAANSQSAVKASDLSANHPFQIAFSNIAKALPTPDNTYWFYQRARGMYDAELEKRKGNRTAGADFQKIYPKTQLLEKTQLALSHLAWEGRCVDCAKGGEHAFSEFAMTHDEWTEEQLTQEMVREMIAKWILFCDLEKSAKRELKKKGYANVRVPVIYTIALFAQRFGARMHWDRVWSRQALSEGLMQALLAMVERVAVLQYQQMGNNMIAMWGRQQACGVKLKQAFTFEGLDFSNVYELS